MLGLSCGGGEGGTEHSASHDDAIALPNERLADDSEPMKVPALNRRFLGLAVTACFLLALSGWALQPSLEYVFRSKTAVLVDQLLGRGCQYQDPDTTSHTLNPLTEWGIRHPEYICPLWAAGNLVKAQGMSASEREIVWRAFEVALSRKPDVFDTGDGVIAYGARMRAIRGALFQPGK